MIPGARPPSVPDLVRAQDRLTFLYLERCVVSRDASAITATDERGTVHIPAATLGALLLGPGTNVTHQAMVLLAESASTVVWVGERGVRYYAHGRSLARSSRLLEAQAQLVTRRDTRLTVARKMYEMRFPGEDVASLTMQQLRGREGARVRRTYREESRRTGVAWTGRDYRPDDFAASDPVNQALSAATTCLYGMTHAVIVALGCSPGLGFVHTGHERSFVYDIADLYKAELAIPVAFDAATLNLADIGGHVRREMRDRMVAAHLLERCVRDVTWLLTGEDADTGQDAEEWADVVMLWDGQGSAVAGARLRDRARGPRLVIVVVLSVTPEKLRGELTRWLLEISAGVYVGHLPARVRERLWTRIVDDVGRGRALMVWSARTEQRLAFRVHNHAWSVEDFDGIALMRRRSVRRDPASAADLPPRQPGEKPEDHESSGGTRTWSNAGRRRRYRSSVEQRRITLKGQDRDPEADE
ncbi:type I-E CRISPR-associated endonuclease Cas1e [Xylanimonas allomyrinae]|uniref:type I-E CRISPR-associated endonuclease Cas1e n=1 Tax=Xylanimonas allomyrinae TaxID=2509459 RepID=UPI0013A67AE8|nr:type I-E CRISPR-associated endonuclease Cas1e [Xylanimonas allomyrinae]